MRTLLLFVFCMAASFAVTPARAHGDVHQRIGIISAEIQEGRPTADQFLQRAELWRLDGDFLAGLADCTAAAKLDPTNSFIHLTRAKLFFDEQKFGKARVELDHFLRKYSDHLEARVLRGRALVRTGDFPAAETDYSMAIKLSNPPQPDTYFEYAQLLRHAGKFHEALSVIDEGIRQLGGAASIEMLAIDIATETKDFDGAVDRIEKISCQSQRKEKWLLRRGEILEKAGRANEAQRSFEKALSALLALPQRFQSTPDSQQTKANILAALRRVKNSHE